eukprot:533376-Pelagomonas_calceolata.AAC.2
MPVQACTTTTAAPGMHPRLAFGTPDGMGLGAYSYQKFVGAVETHVDNEPSRASVNGARPKNFF